MTKSTKLNDGTIFPLIGLGVMTIPDADLPAVIRSAAGLGYRSFDTAPVYGNEKGTGRGIRECGVPREDISVTTKLWNNRQGYDEALRAFDESLATLGLDYVDVYLIHWPVPANDRYADSWRALVRIKEEGRVKSIGVSNFLPEHLERIIGETGVAPALNQIELHPEWQQTELRAYHAKHGIVAEAWSPLGRGKALHTPEIVAIASRAGCTPAQLILAYLAGEGIVVIPRSSSAGHIKENIDAIGITLDQSSTSAIRALDSAYGRFGPDPLKFETIPG
ncbi:aldo/keto reductase [Novosphingobium sp. G106]|uniref:aldo/keto reductase n=1 Tax=Novosphingobium sp. G106 TaxID=2849500 RepID=UPI001C2D1F86|nr:aldo/keto reductase [Novosphingobium sp. G106]MBV1688900.1 aldo/keto reductase [Novosphingobium sp. G106]